MADARDRALSDSSARGPETRRRHVDALRDSLRWMPEGPYRFFWAWAMDDESVAPRWLQLLGVDSLLWLNDHLLDGLLDDAERDRLARYGPPMTVYLTYEALSDNLAIGLAAEAGGEPGRRARSLVVRAFNRAMLDRLAGTGAADAQARLIGAEPPRRTVSNFRQSLSEDEHRDLVRAYVLAHPGAEVDDIEFAVMPPLLANIESAAAVLDGVRDLAGAEVFRDGLKRRYEAVEELVASTGRAADAAADADGIGERQLAIGADAILVMPTLAYQIGVIAEVVRPLPGYPAVLADGSLLRVLRDAALLVRLLNDCGTRLLEQDAALHAVLVAELEAVAQSRPGASLEDALRRPALREIGAFNRLVKDIVFGEFNICLDGIRARPASPSTFAAFRTRLDRVRAVYRQRTGALREAAAVLSRRLGDEAPSRIVTRFVDFHRRMYAQPSDTRIGEYAIADGAGDPARPSVGFPDTPSEPAS